MLSPYCPNIHDSFLSFYAKYVASRFSYPKGTSYSAVLDQARFQKSRILLKDTDEKLLNISLMLGYENASTFSRAFKRWAGVTPKEFRKLHH